MRTLPVLECIEKQADVQTRYDNKLNAEGSSNGISIFSDSVNYSLIQKLSVKRFTPNGKAMPVASDRLLTWRHFYGFAKEVILYQY